MVEDPLVAAFCGDTHLTGRGAWANRPILGDALVSFTQIVDFAIARKLQWLILAGDVQDAVLNTPTAPTFLYQQIDRCKVAGVQFGFILGQHDLFDPPWPSGNPWAQYLNGAYITIAGQKVFCVDYVAPPLTGVALAAVESGTNIIVGHQTFAEVARGKPADLSLSDLPVGETAFFGDWHEQHIIEGTNGAGNPIRLITPGSTAMQAIDEPPEKYFFTMTQSGVWKRVKLKTRPMLDYSLLSDADVDSLLPTIPDALAQALAGTAGFDERIRKPLLRITVSAQTSPRCGEMTKLIGSAAHLFWKQLPREAPATQQADRQTRTDTTGRTNAATLLSELPKYLELNGATELLEPCQVLLGAGENVAGVLQQLRVAALADVSAEP
jgi:hypothetical protein